MVVVTGSRNIRNAVSEWKRKKAERDKEKNKSRSVKNVESAEKLQTPLPVSVINENKTLREENKSLLQKYWDYRKNQIDVKAVTASYNFVDRYLFGGRLAGGQTELDVVNQSIVNNQDLLNAEGSLYDLENARLRQDLLQNRQDDLLNKSWYENFGIGYSDDEKFLRNMFDMQASAVENSLQLPKTASSIERYETIIRETPNAANIIKQATPQGTDWGKIALIGGLGVAGLMVLSKKL